MNKIILFLLCISPLSDVFAQSDSLLQKYRSMALEYNQDLKAAEKNIQASIEIEKSARSDQKPSLTGATNFKYTGNPSELTLNLPGASQPIGFRGNEMQYGISVSLMQPIYTGGRLLESIRLAQQQQLLAVHQSEAIRSAVCYQADIQYWNTVARREIMSVVTDFRNSVASLTTTIKERVEAGLVDPQDLLMAEVKLNEADYQLLQAQNDFETGRMSLNSFVGIPLHTPTDIQTEIPRFIPADSILTQTTVNRPEIKIAQTRIELAEINLKLKDSQYKPQLFVGVDGSYSSPGYNFNKDLDPNYAAYAKLSVPLFEWGKRRSEKRAAQYYIGMTQDDLSKVEDHVSLEIQMAKVALQQAMERTELSGNSLQKAAENEQKALERYHEGKVSILEVIDAQTYRQTAQIYYVQAKVAAQSYYSELLKALNAYF